jgi:hypothetical protein
VNRLVVGLKNRLRSKQNNLEQSIRDLESRKAPLFNGA